MKIVYCPESHVEHSHNYTLRELAKRFRGEGAADRVIFGESPSLAREIFGGADPMSLPPRDRIDAVKRFFSSHVGRMVSLQQGGERWEGVEPRAKAVSKRAVTASEKEQSENPRSRSAKLRAVEKER